VIEVAADMEVDSKDEEINTNEDVIMSNPEEETNATGDNSPMDIRSDVPSFDEGAPSDESPISMEADVESPVEPTSPGIESTTSEETKMEEEFVPAATTANSLETFKLIEMLRSDEVADRFSAMGQLETIAIGLGEERTKNELIPFLTESTDDEDDVLVAMAEHISSLIKHVGGVENYKLLLSPLELLLMVEETTVREKAVESCKIVAEMLPLKTFQNEYTEMLEKLARKEWFTARMSACSLIAFGFSRLAPAQREKNMQLFAKLCRDDVPLVRRVASHSLGIMFTNAVTVLGLSSISEPEGAINRLIIPLYEELARNDQDSVRLQTTENCVMFGRAITEIMKKDPKSFMQQEELTDKILPLLVSTIEDRSWRVRWTAASKFNEAVHAFSFLTGAVAELIPAYEKLLQDTEAEVRTAATFNIADVARCSDKVGPEVVDRLLMRVATLTDDDSEHVRAALAMVATELAPILGKDKTIQHLLPPLLLLLRDPSSEVRLNLISSLSPLNDVIGVDLLSQSLYPAIVDLSEDRKWRIRLAIINHIPLLAKQLGRDFFSEKLSKLCVAWLGDDISTIREAAAKNLMFLTELFGSKWTVDHILPLLVEIREHQSYLRRLTAVQACSLMATKMDLEGATNKLLPMVVEMASDNVPNIRFNVAMALERMAPFCGERSYRSTIRPVLLVLIEDPDRDVRYFAEKSLNAADKAFQIGFTINTAP